MDISIVPIGNSKGIRLSKSLLERYNLKDTVELILEEDCIVLKAKAKPRKGWEESFKSMAENGGDKLLVNDVFEDEAFEEWK
jgi:antitoxin MazE